MRMDARAAATSRARRRQRERRRRPRRLVAALLAGALAGPSAAAASNDEMKSQALQYRDQLPSFPAQQRVELFHLLKTEELPLLSDDDDSTPKYYATTAGLGFRRTPNRYEKDLPSEANSVFFAPVGSTGAHTADRDTFLPQVSADGTLMPRNTINGVRFIPDVSSDFWDASTYMGVCTGLTFDQLADFMISYNSTVCDRGQPLRVKAGESVAFRSCDSHDFLEAAYAFLAQIGLGMRPFITPRREEIIVEAVYDAPLPALPPLRRNPLYYGTAADYAAAAAAARADPAAAEVLAAVLSTDEGTPEAAIAEAEAAGAVAVDARAIAGWYEDLRACLAAKLDGGNRDAVELTALTHDMNSCYTQMSRVEIADRAPGVPEGTTRTVSEVYIYVDGTYFVRVRTNPTLEHATYLMKILAIAIPHPKVYSVHDRFGAADVIVSLLMVAGALFGLTKLAAKLGILGEKRMREEYLEAPFLRFGRRSAPPGSPASPSMRQALILDPSRETFELESGSGGAVGGAVGGAG